MIPDKIIWYLGYNNLGLMLEQERKHWLLKTDKRKQIQDKATGDIFEGEIDNRGSDVKVKSSKLPIKTTILPKLSFTDERTNKVLDFSNAAFPFSMGMKGFMFARITSINYPDGDIDVTHYRNYRIVFNGATKKTLAFGVSPYSSEVYAGEWIETSTPPILQMMDDIGEYTIEVPLTINNATHTKYYYPLEPGLQPFEISNVAVGKYISESINDDAYIGYPLFWFTADETRTGPTVELGSSGYNSSHMAYMVFSTEGNSGSMYNGKAYVNVDGTASTGATPDLSLPSEWEIRCNCYGTDSFTNSDADFEKDIDFNHIYFYKKSTGDTTDIPIDSGDGESNVFRMIKDIGWTYVDNTTYTIDMDLFESNNEAQSGTPNPLAALFDVFLDKTVPYYTEDKANLGYAGIEFTAANPLMDTDARYPHDLDKWDGLPTWFGEPGSSGVPQHMAIYAIHNTPMYSEMNPESRQVAALLLDPGTMKVDDSEELAENEIGRIYVLSNDDPEYENNATAKYPKPARTVARICDIPTSVSDFLNVEGLVPVSIVDPKYVRSDASYTDSEKNRLWNVLNSKVVTPLAKDQYGNPFYGGSNPREYYPYIWGSIENLNKVDLIYNNDFREWINLNSMVDPTTVSLYSIANPGTGYEVNSTGIIIIGGVAMNYIVNAVDDEGGVTEATVVPEDNSVFINLSNFDMVDDNSGITKKYGTTPASGGGVARAGEGLEVVLRIDNYASIKMQQGNIYDDLVAFVYVGDRMKLYRYITNSTNPFHVGHWEESLTVTYFDKTDSNLKTGGYSSADALTNMLIPHIKNINVCSQTEGRGLSAIAAMVTPSFMNIIDTAHSPIKLTGGGLNPYSRVDLCGFHCDGITTSASPRDDENYVLSLIKEAVTLDRDAYLIWRWTDSNHRNFAYGIIRRSMNNYVTTDTTTTIPATPGITYNAWIHTNNGTTVVWDVPEVGPMMWVYNPNYNRKEIYTIDENTQELFLSYSNETDPDHPNEMNWDDIDFKLNPRSSQVEKITNEGVFLWNVYTNTPAQGTPMSSPYNEYEYTKIASQGDPVAGAPRPVGNWQLVFPRVNEYKIVSTGIQEGVYNTEVKLRRLVPLIGESLGNVQNVQDIHGHTINQKVVLFDQGESGTKMKIWNKESGQFEIV